MQSKEPVYNVQGVDVPLTYSEAQQYLQSMAKAQGATEEQASKYATGALYQIGAYQIGAQGGGCASPAGSTWPTGPLGQGMLSVSKADPDKARILLLGFDSGATIAAAASSTVTEQPQDTFKPSKVLIPSTIAPAFVLTDIKIGSVSQLSSDSGIPGETFLPNAGDMELQLDTAQVSQNVSLTVSNVSGNAVRFRATMKGYALRF